MNINITNLFEDLAGIKRKMVENPDNYRDLKIYKSWFVLNSIKEINSLEPAIPKLLSNIDIMDLPDKLYKRDKERLAKRYNNFMKFYNLSKKRR